MFFLKAFLIRILFFLIFIGFTSCVKDVDLDQAGEISLRPKLLVDLLFFDVDDTVFIDQAANQQNTIIRDTVRLEFLDDSYIQKDLSEVEFSFKYINSSTRSFSNTITFLSEQNSPQHMVSFNVDAGDKKNPVVTEKVELIESGQIEVIRRSIKMVVEVEVLPGDKPFAGGLKFESKGLFSFEF